jgi:uncharacterized ubiquitin-like protein YukD
MMPINNISSPHFERYKESLKIEAKLKKNSSYHYCKYLGILVILYVVFSLSFSTNQYEIHQVLRKFDDYDNKRIVCRYKKYQLNNLIWSHRGHWKDEEVDSSMKSLTALLQGGIYNYDVDIVLLSPSTGQSNSSYLFVAHPTMIDSQSHQRNSLKMSEILTIDNFIDIIIKSPQIIGSNETIRPFISLEPKFDSLDSIDKLIQLGIAHGDQIDTAIIVSNIQMLQKIEKRLMSYQFSAYLPHIGLAYRTVISNTSSSIPLKWSSNPPPVYIQNANVIKQLHMPDIHFFLTQYMNKTYAIRNSRIYNKFRQPEPVVTWVVDDEDYVWKLLNLGVTAMISNKPIELLQRLHQAYDELCVSPSL